MKFIHFILNKKTAYLWHPESAERVKVTRTWLGRLIKPICFATGTEVLKANIEWKTNELKKFSTETRNS